MQGSRESRSAGGRLVIVDQVHGSAPTPLAATIVNLLALQYVVALGSDPFHWDHLVTWCASASLETPRKRALRTAPGAVLVTARKPG